MLVKLRILLLVTAVLTACWILYKIRKHKVKMEHAIFWVVFAGILTVFGLFPQVAYWLADVFGIQTPANLIFLIIIFLLSGKIFTLSILVSQLEEKVFALASDLALKGQEMSARLDALEEKK